MQRLSWRMYMVICVSGWKWKAQKCVGFVVGGLVTDSPTHCRGLRLALGQWARSRKLF